MAATAACVLAGSLERTSTLSTAGACRPAAVRRLEACWDSPVPDPELLSVFVPARVPPTVQATIKSSQSPIVRFGRRAAARAAPPTARARRPRDCDWGCECMRRRLPTHTAVVVGVRRRLGLARAPGSGWGLPQLERPVARPRTTTDRLRPAFEMECPS